MMMIVNIKCRFPMMPGEMTLTSRTKLHMLCDDVCLFRFKVDLKVRICICEK